MQGTTASLVFAVDARQVSGATAALDGLLGAGKRAETAASTIEKSLQGVNRSAQPVSATMRTVARETRAAAASTQSAASVLQSQFASLKGAIGGLSAAALAREFIQSADAMASLSARISLATSSTQDFERAQRQLISLAQDTRTGLGQTADLFTSLTRSTEALGVSQDDVLGVTRTINQALVVSGANAQSAAAALVQLGQGFASGTLRGEELNSVLEQAPRLARAIADGLGVTVGQLRQLGQDGKLTAEQVFGAIQKGGATIEAEFRRMPLTVGQATTQAGNALLVLSGVIDSTSGASTALASAISTASAATIDLAGEIKRAAGAKDVGVLAEAFLTVSETVQVLFANTKFVFEGIGREIGGIAAQVTSLARLDFRGFSAISDAMKADAELARKEVDRVTAEILARRPSALEVLRRKEDRGFDPLAKPRTSGPVSGTGDKASKTDPFDAELKSLRERNALLGKESELEKLNAQIALGKFGKLTEARRLELQYLAISIDQAKDEADAMKAAATARDAATDALTRASMTALDALPASREQNKSLAEEIELIGASATARAAIENARIESLITSKSQLITERELAGIGDERNQVLQEEIDLLRERQQLISTKALKEVEIDAKDVGKKTSDTLSQSIEEGILTGFRGGLSLAELFRRELQAQFAKTVLRPVIEPVVAAGQKAAGGLFSELFGLAQAGLGFFSGGVGITAGDSPLSATGELIRGRRASGGPVERNSLYQVNERGPELLTMGNKQFLMMGAQAGHITPNSALSGGGITVINQTSGRVDKATMVTLPDGERALLLQEAAELAERRGDEQPEQSEQPHEQGAPAQPQDREEPLMAKWSIPLAGVIDKMGADATTVVRKTAFDAFRRVIERSPVGNPELWAANEQAGVGRSMRDLYGEVAAANNEAGGRRMGTGRATVEMLLPLVAGKGYVGGRFRASWTYSEGAPTAAAPPETTDASRALSEAGKALTADLGRVIYLVNNLPYAHRLEYGWSSQAPAGIVRLTAMEFDDFFKRNLATLG